MKPAGVDWLQLHGNRFAGVRALVTGGAGFIGSHLCQALAALGASVVALDDLSGGSKDNLASLGPVEFVEGSILDLRCLSECARGCQLVFHLAALGSVPRSVEQPRLYADVNVTGTLNVLEAAGDARVSRVLFAASSSVYGDSPVPWIETLPTAPRSPYAATKLAGEAFMRAYSASYAIDTASLRYFNIFGPRQNANSAYAAVIAAFAKSLLGGKRPVIYGDGEQSRDFTFVANAVQANLLCASLDRPLSGEVINVGCGNPMTVNQLARTMAAGYGRTDLTPTYEPPRTGDIRHSFADLGRSRRLLAYEPIVPTNAGLEETMAWYRSAIAA